MCHQIGVRDNLTTKLWPQAVRLREAKCVGVKKAWPQAMNIKKETPKAKPT